MVSFVTDLPHPYNKVGDGPEGPECAKVADGLRKRISGRTLVSIELTDSAKHDGLDRLDLPKKILKVASHGKKILIFLEGDVLIGNELRMTGSWRSVPSKHLRFSLVLRGEGGVEASKMHFISSRNLGKTVALCTPQQKEAYFARVGPDLLKTVIPRDEWIERYRTMTKKRKGSKPFLICDALIEQRIFSGVGNFLRADIMYAARMKPDRPVQDLEDEELERLRVAAHMLIRKAYDNNGYTLRDYRMVDGSKGSYITLIYNQKTDALGNPVIKSRFPGKWPKRYVHWVPAIQK